MKKVNFIDRRNAKKFLELENFEDGRIDFISISDTNKEKEAMRHLWENVKGDYSAAAFLNFADVEHADLAGFNDNKANQIVSFLSETYRKKKTLLVHCFAGISRSGAVAKYYNDFYGLNDYYLNNYVGHNRMVYNTLLEQSGVTTMRSYYTKLENK
jgi:protein tyrosine/serine phosphatase